MYLEYLGQRAQGGEAGMRQEARRKGWWGDSTAKRVEGVCSSMEIFCLKMGWVGHRANEPSRRLPNESNEGSTKA
jgi:hypothetical protein